MIRCARLELTGFRNYEGLAIDIPPGGCLLVGPNGSGKSNLLEALQLLAVGRGANPSGGAELIRIDKQGIRADFARVGGTMESSPSPDCQLEVVIAAPAGGRSGQVDRRFRIDGQIVPRRSLLGRLPLVRFDPRDMDLITGRPADRRRFVNRSIGQADQYYVSALAEYERARRHRNALLKALRDGKSADPGQLDHWDGLLAAHGEILTAARINWLEQITLLAQDLFSRLAKGPQNLELVFQPSVSLDTPHALACAYQAGRNRELAFGATLFGPHRDDFQMRFDNHPASSYASRGQQRLGLLCLKLALLKWLTDQLGSTPVLSLDDVYSELDPDHRSLLTENLPLDCQLFLASADDRQVPPSIADRCRRFLVREGDARSN